MNNDQVLERYLGRIDSPRTQQACRARIHWMCQNVAGERVLDIGCSQGICPLILGREGRNVVGLDIEDVAIQTARQALADEPAHVRERVQFMVADAFVAQFEPASFDTVIIGEVLEHLAMPAKLIEKVDEWLVAGGRLVVSVPLGYHPYHDHKRTFYLSNLLDLLGERFGVVDVAAVEDLYLCAVAIKPQPGEAPQPPDERALRAWNRACEQALERFERELYEKWRGDRERLSEHVSSLKARVAELRDSAQVGRDELGRQRRGQRETQRELDRARQQFNRARQEASALLLKLRRAEADAASQLEELGEGLATTRAELRDTTKAFKSTAAQLHPIKQHNRFYKAELARRDEEIRYLLGDALVKAARPSLHTILLPGRIVKLLMLGLRRRRERKRQARAADAGQTPTNTPAGEAPRPAPVGQASKPVANVVPADSDRAGPAAKVAAEPSATGPLRPTPEGTGPRTPNPPAVGFLFFCVNGAGLGHLTRSLAIARRIRRIDSEVPICFLSSSQALGVIGREGITAFHIPPRGLHGDQMSAKEWNSLLLQQLRAIVETCRPAVLVYDGVSPYAGLISAIKEMNFSHTAMVLRLRHKHDRLSKLTDRLAQFGQLILPGEVGVDVPLGLSTLNHRVFDPIIYLDRDEALPREEVRRRWKIPPEKKAVYVQLGAGNINDIGPWVDHILAVLAERNDVQVILAESPIAEQAHEHGDNVQILSHYPNSLYFNGLDLAITAAGYNTYHELMHFGVPAVLVPNQDTKTDDQVARARTAERASAAKVVLGVEQLKPAILEALRPEVAESLRHNAMALVTANGAHSVAECLLGMAGSRADAVDKLAEVETSPVVSR